MAEHTWRLDDRGEIDYIELGIPGESFCGGPQCIVCEEFFCQHEPDFDWHAECPGAPDE